MSKAQKDNVKFEEAHLYNIIHSQLVTEKSSRITENNCLTFKVQKDADKETIKSAIEKIFGVQVKSVNTMIVKGKTKRFRGRKGVRSDVKKAMVTLAEGSQIELATGA